MPRVRYFSAMAVALILYASARPVPGVETGPPLGLKRVAVLGDARLRHADQVTAIVPLSDGKRFVSSARDRTVRLWEVESGRELRRFVHPDSSWSVAVHPDEKTCISTGGKKDLLEWDLGTGQQIHRLTGHENTVFRCAFNPDGTRLLSGDGGPEAFEWSLRGQAVVLRKFKVGGKDDAVYGTAWSPDSNRFALGGQQKQIWIFDAVSGECLRKLDRVTKDLYTLQFSPDGKHLISTAGDNAVRLWRVEDGKEIWKADCGKDVKIAAYSPDGTLVAVGVEDGSVRVLDAADGRERLRIDTRGDGIWPVAFSPDGKQLLAGGSCLVYRFDVASGERLFPSADYKGPCTPLASVILDPHSGRLICSSQSDKAIFVYDPRAGHVVARWANEEGLSHLVLSGDGRRLFGRERGKLAAWDVASGQRLWARDTGGYPDEVAASHDGARLILLDSNEQTILDGSTGEQLRKVETSAQGGHTQHMVVAPGGQMVVACNGEGTGTIFRLPDLTVAGRLGLPTKERKADEEVELDPDGSGPRVKYINVRDGVVLPGSGVLLMIDDDKILRQWRPRVEETLEMTDAGLREALAGLSDESFPVRQDAIQRLVAFGDQVLPALDGVRVEENQGLSQAVAFVRSALATRLLPTRLSPQVLRFEEHVSCLRGHPDGVHWAAVEGYGTKSLVLGRATAEGVAILARIEDPNLPNGIAFSADGRYLYAVNGNCTISVYELTADAAGGDAP